jgi:hypothetical protein
MTQLLDIPLNLSFFAGTASCVQEETTRKPSVGQNKNPGNAYVPYHLFFSFSLFH